MTATIVTLTVNGLDKQFLVQPQTTLLLGLREQLGLSGAKRGCSQGACGSCTVLLDGCPVVSCLVPAATVDGSQVDTVEGLADGRQLSDVQQAFIDGFATQCGYCTPGMIMSAEALLARNPDPTSAEVAEAISGNVCRCTGYEPIISAILDAAERRRTRLSDNPPDAGAADGGQPETNAPTNAEAPTNANAPTDAVAPTNAEAAR